MLLSTVVVAFAGAAGIYGFERSGPGEGGVDSYATALWWTAMILTTMGSESWPWMPEGRLLCLLLAIYAFMIFGYITTSLASFFVGRGVEDPEAEVAGAKALEASREEIAALRSELQRLALPHRHLGGGEPGPRSGAAENAGRGDRI